MLLVSLFLGLRELPEDFPTTLRNLTRMNLSENELTEDSFPETMTSMASLVEIDISDNKLTVVPKCICNMRRLKRLYVGKGLSCITTSCQILNAVLQCNFDVGLPFDPKSCANSTNRTD